MDIVEQLRKSANTIYKQDGYTFRLGLQKEAADEIERLREALKTFANNVRETNAEIDKNWAKTIYPLKAENQRLREALQHMVRWHDQLSPADIAKAEAALKEGK